METLELQPLPYDEISGAGRDQVREMVKTSGGKIAKQSYLIDVDHINIRGGFNLRERPSTVSEKEYMESSDWMDIPALADGIYESGGAAHPLKLDATDDGLFYLHDGWRRLHAYRHLLATGRTEYADGRPVRLAECVINPKDTTELDRLTAIMTTQDNKKLRPMEWARGIRMMQDMFGLSRQQIAQKLGKSRQWIDNKFSLLGIPDQIQEAITNNQISETAALTLSRTGLTETEMVHKVEESINKGAPLKVNQVSELEAREKRENKEQFLPGMDMDDSNEKKKALEAAKNTIKLSDSIRPYLKGFKTEQAQLDVDAKLDWIIGNVELMQAYIKKADIR